jgi:DNA (cytosine-5)-methyltransferase 1
MLVLGGIDNDSDAGSTYRLNFPDAHFILSDIRHLGVDHVLSEFPLDRVDRLVLAACAPCQPFSKQRTIRRDDDDRVSLLMELGRFVDGLRPDAVLIENVPGIQTFDGDHGPLAEFLELIRELGYQDEVDTIEARSFGVPQHRSRLVVFSSRHGKPGFPKATHSPTAKPYATVRDWIGDLPPIAAGRAHGVVKNHRAHELSEMNLKRIRATPEGGGRLDWPKELWLDCHSGEYHGHTDVYGRLSWDAPASGLTTRCISYSNGRFGHPEQDRAISVREAACLQTFPQDFEFTGNMASMARQIGNAVPVVLAEALGRHLAAHLIEATASQDTQDLGQVA